MSHQSKKNENFGRDEMFALLGGDLRESLTRAPSKTTSGSKQYGSAAKSKRDSKKDFADMTVEETAAYLLEENKRKAKKIQSHRPTSAGASHHPNRHRSSKQRQYQALALEQTPAEILTKPAPNQHQERDSSSSDESSPIASTSALEGKRARRPRYDSSSSSSDSDEPTARRSTLMHRHDSEGDSSSDGDDRRQRLLAKRRAAAAAADHKSEHRVEAIHSTSHDDDADSDTKSAIHTDEKEIISEDHTQGQMERKNETICAADVMSTGDMESDSSSNDESSSSSNESSSSDDEEEILVKPVFVPKHKRGTIKAITDEQKEEESFKNKKQEQELRRQKESRAMVQQVIALAKLDAAVDEDTGIDGVLHAHNEIPNDDDDIDHDAWEIRELKRILQNIDAEETRLQEEKEKLRRRNMTDEERMQEDIKNGLYRKPGQQREASEQNKPQRYYHKGAFFMDEDEWEEGDVRRKASEYAKAATGDDKIDKASLPEVMRVKKFGRSGQGRYKGLVSEDTTDKTVATLPLLNATRKGK